MGAQGSKTEVTTVSTTRPSVMGSKSDMFGVNGADRSKTEVVSVDTARYAGTWYSIGGYRHKWDTDCVGSMVNYTPIEGSAGHLFQIQKACYAPGTGGNDAWARWDLRMTRVEKGILRINGDHLTTQMESHPDEAWNKKLLWTDYDNIAIVGSHPDHLWILSRKPQLSEVELELVKDKITQMGFALHKVVLTPNGADYTR